MLSDEQARLGEKKQKEKQEEGKMGRKNGKTHRKQN